jgi:hypothetical protein
MVRYLNILLVLVAITGEATLRAATKPHAGPAPKAKGAWRNEDLERLRRIPGLISIVGQPTDERVNDVSGPSRQSSDEDTGWYAAQAASLNTRLKAEQADLNDFTQALEDTRELKTTTGGVNLAEDDIGITPEATIQILQNRGRETKSQLDALEDLARRNGVPPGILRDPWRYSDEKDKAVATGGTIARDRSVDRGDL